MGVCDDPAGGPMEVGSSYHTFDAATLMDKITDGVGGDDTCNDDADIDDQIARQVHLTYLVLILAHSVIASLSLLFCCAAVMDAKVYVWSMYM